MSTVPRKTRSRFPIFLLLGGLFVAGAIGFAILAQTPISGTEFSPLNFQQRTFSYSRWPGSKIRLSDTLLGPSTAVASVEILKHLPTPSQPLVWHVTEVSGITPEPHAAKILIRLLNDRNADGYPYWTAWSHKNPSLAAILWPLVQEVALHELYRILPSIFRRAESISEPTLLELALHQEIAEAVRAESILLEDEGNEAAAAGLAQWFVDLPLRSNDSDFLDEIRKLRQEFAAPRNAPQEKSR
jgi:hypothetical protein